MHGRFLVRKMLPSDVDKVEKFYSSTTKLKYRHETYKRLISDVSNALVLVELQANDKQKIIGCSSTIRCWKSKWSRVRHAYLSTFAISKKYRKQGLGTLLLNVTLRILKVFFDVEIVMADIPKLCESDFLFFRNRGFNGEKVCEKFYRMNNEHEDLEDSVFMMKDLTDWKIEFALPENVEIASDLEYFLNNKQHLGLLARWLGHP